MSVDDARARIPKKTVSEVEKAEAILKAHKEKQKKVWTKISREAAKAGRTRVKKLKDRKRLMQKLIVEIGEKK